jgi:glycosyltransferase involved in cell wall biosynthesis
MKASIIIPTCRRSAQLFRAIDSALNQTFDDFEVIVVDDNGAGTDFQINNAQKLIRYIKNNKFQYEILEHNMGACHARNRGAEIAKGDYLFFLDDDDEFLPQKLAVQSAFLDKNPEFAAQICAMRRFDSSGKEIISHENFPRGEDFISFSQNGNFFTPMLAIRKTCFLQSGGFDDIFRFQDQFFMLKFLLNGYKIGLDTEQLYIMHEHDNFRITNTSIEKSIAAIEQIHEFKVKQRRRFSDWQWKTVEKKFLQAKASVYITSNSIISRLKAFVLYFMLFIIKPSLSDFKAAIRSLIPVPIKKQ